MGRASSHAFTTPPPNIRGARSYQFMAGGSVAMRCRSPSAAHEELLHLATRQRAVLGATFLDSNDSNGNLSVHAGLSEDVRARA